MLRRVWISVVVWGLAITGGSWVVAGAMALAGSSAGFTVGWAKGERWLVNAMVYSDGWVYFRKFAPNLTHHDGLYAGTLSGLRPTAGRAGNQGSLTWRVHLGLPTAVFVLLSAHAVVWPLVRRWRRIKRRLCIGCGYPIGESLVCTECGRPHC